MMTLSSSPSAHSELSKMKQEKCAVIEGFHQEELDLAHEVKTLNQFCAAIHGTENGKIDTHLLAQAQAALTSFGVSAEEALSDDELLQMLQDQIQTLQRDDIEKKSADSKESIETRMMELKDRMELRPLLNTIRSEFGDQIDKETNAVLEKYEALFDSAFITDEKERGAVETLFWQQGSTDFSESGFQGFIETIQTQPDTVISQETKLKIRERFTTKPNAPKTGTALLKAIHTKDDKGIPIHYSPETAIQLDSGISTYTTKNGRTVMTYPNLGNDTSHTEYVNANESLSGEFIAQQINTNLTRSLVYNEFHGMIGLFGGTETEGVFQAHYEGDTMRTSHQFVTALVGHREKGEILTPPELSKIKISLQALVNPLNSNEAEDLQGMEELGIIQNEEMNWKQLERAGRILRENNAFKLHAMSDSTAPHRLLKRALIEPETEVRAA